MSMQRQRPIRIASFFRPEPLEPDAMQVSGAPISGHYLAVNRLALSVSNFAGATLVATALTSGCATSARPRPEPSAAVLTSPTELPAIASPAPPHARLAWVNPARCLPVCAVDPAANLVQVNELGVLAPSGRHRVAAETQPELQALIAAARGNGHTIRIASTFRSYEAQARLFE
jgi:LAS superfamily LD-carboxypeptidase LdcB